jgi:chaperonin GroES
MTKDNNIRPLYNNILVERLEAKTITSGGIIIPNTTKKKPSKGRIIAISNGNKNSDGKIIPLDVKVGDKVLFIKWSGMEIEIDNRDLLIMKESDILAIFED